MQAFRERNDDGSCITPASLANDDALPAWLLPEDVVGAGEVRKKKRSRASTETKRLEQVKRACEPCRRSKLKCQAELPCGQCISRGIEQCCVPSGETGRLQLPIALRGYLKTSGAPGDFSDSGIDQLLMHMPTCELGWRASDLRAYLNGLTPVVFEQVYKSLQRMNELRAQTLQSGGQGFPTGQKTILEHDMWSGHPTIGVFQIDYDPSRDAATGIYSNQRFASLLGFSRQELLKLIATNDLPLSLPHLDLTFMIFGDLDSWDSLLDEAPLRVFPHRKDAAPVHVRAQRQRMFNRSGCLVRVTYFWEVVSASTYLALRDKYWGLNKAAAQGGSGRPAAASLHCPDSLARLTVAQVQAHCDDGFRCVERLREEGEDALWRAGRAQESAPPPRPAAVPSSIAPGSFSSGGQYGAGPTLSAGFAGRVAPTGMSSAPPGGPMAPSGSMGGVPSRAPSGGMPPSSRAMSSGGMDVAQSGSMQSGGLSGGPAGRGGYMDERDGGIDEGIKALRGQAASRRGMDPMEEGIRAMEGLGMEVPRRRMQSQGMWDLVPTTQTTPPGLDLVIHHPVHLQYPMGSSMPDLGEGNQYPRSSKAAMGLMRGTDVPKPKLKQHMWDSSHMHKQHVGGWDARVAMEPMSSGAFDNGQLKKQHSFFPAPAIEDDSSLMMSQLQH